MYSLLGLLKLFLRELPEPLLTYGLYDEFIAAIQDNSRLPSLVASLPLSHQIVLEKILNLFGKVLEHTDKNKMDLAALATCLSQNLLTQKNQAPDMLMQESSSVKQVLELLIQKRNEFTYRASSHSIL
jgi:hypothetical protein